MAEVAKCQNCGWSIDEHQSEPRCITCGEPLSAEIRSRLHKLVAVAEAAAATGGGGSTQAQSGSPVVNRYRDAYRVGTALVGLGNGIKIIGVILGLLILIISLASTNNQFGGSGLAGVGVFVAIIAGALFWVCGVVIAAQGEILRATLDTAVASSHFLTDPERADAMGLSRSAVERAAA